MPAEICEWVPYNLVAIGNTEQFSIYSLGEPITAIFGISRNEFGKDFIKTGSACCLDWGFGITPNILRERSKCLLAIAWDKVLQICIVEDPERGLDGVTMDGYYISDYPIDKVMFVSDSVLVVLVNK